ncbi:MAG: hypothetical protein ACLFPE_12355 [Bacteroidales bacterium]
MRNIRLIRKKERYGLTGWGWLTVLVFFLLAGWIIIKGIVPFLSKSDPVEARVMVVEGYIPDKSLHEIIRIFRENNYELLISTGPTYDQGFFATGIRSAAHLIGYSLLRLGFDSTKLAIVPVPGEIFRDRTYNSALVSRAYLEKNRPDIRRINLVSQSVHARRSCNLYRMAFPPEIEVGNIVIPTDGIRSGNWYRSSRGFRTVVNEAIAYLYVILFFHP